MLWGITYVMNTVFVFNFSERTRNISQARAKRIKQENGHILQLALIVGSFCFGYLPRAGTDIFLMIVIKKGLLTVFNSQSGHEQLGPPTAQCFLRFNEKRELSSRRREMQK